MAMAVGLSMAVVSISKALFLLGALCLVLSLFWTTVPSSGVCAMLLLCALLYCLYRDMCLGERPAVHAGVSAVAALLISCMFNSILFDAAIGDFFCVTIGLLMALSLRTAVEPPQEGRAA